MSITPTIATLPGRAVGVVVLLVVCRVVGVGDCHELVVRPKYRWRWSRSPYQLSLVSSQVRSIWHHLPSIFTAFQVWPLPVMRPLAMPAASRSLA